MASTSASSSSGAMSNMSRLLSSSRLATYHPKVHQVYTAPASHISRGDFGLKRPLPTSHLSPGQIRFVGVENVDTKEGQTAWREKEREVLLHKRLRELNVKFDTSHPEQAGALFEKVSSKKGTLGPRINTRYDISSRRALPTDFDIVADTADREYLQSEAQLGRAPVYSRSAYDFEDDDAFGRVSDHYTTSPSIRLNFRTMSKNQFEKYLEEIRKKRGSFKDHLAAREAAIARARVASQYAAQREELIKKARQAQSEAAEGETISMDIPARVRDVDLPLLKRGVIGEYSVNIDLWEEARNSSYLQRQWDPWLQSKDLTTVKKSDSQHLPPMTTKMGGYEIPTAMHAHGGLQYGQPDDISTQSLHDSLPARVLGRSVNPDKRYANYGRAQSDLAVALGGNIAVMPSVMSNQATSIDTSGNDPLKGNIRVKVTKASREVKTESNDHFGNRRSFQTYDDKLPHPHGTIKLSVRSSDLTDRRNQIRGVPGSADWISLEPGRGRDSTIIDLTDLDNLASGTSYNESAFRIRKSLDEYEGYSKTDRQRRARAERARMPASSSRRGLDLFSDIVKPYEQETKPAAEKAESATASD